MIRVVGAGMAGLLASAMLRDKCLSVIERSPVVPNSHTALLRFRSSIVGDTLGITFKKVKVLKTIAEWSNPLADAVAYSMKTNGTASLRSIVSAKGEISERYIAPTDLVQRMASLSDHKLLLDYDFIPDEKIPTISTIPMPSLMAMLEYISGQNFESRSGVNIIVDLKNSDIYASLYVPNPNLLMSRISITGDKMIIEVYKFPDLAASHAQEIVEQSLNLCGMGENNYISHEIKHQKYAKILPIDDDERKRFIIWASDNHNIYSLGRFATWRPNLLLDDVVNDVRQIVRLSEGHSRYEVKIKMEK